MKILYLDTPINPPGGGQLSLLSMAVEIKKKFGVKVFIHENSPFEARLKEAGIDCEVVSVRNIYHAFKREAPDLVHCNSATTRYSFVSALACRFLGIPFLWHVRVTERAGLKDDIIAFLSSGIIVISDAVRNKFRRLWRGKTVKIYNGIDPLELEPGNPREAVRSALGFKGEKVIGIFSRMVIWKGHELFLAVARKIADTDSACRFLIVGEGEELANIKALISRLNLGGRVVIAGYKRKVSDYMNICDIVMSTSIKDEGFGRTLVEAMFLGKPVISTRCGGPGEIISDGEDGFLCDADPGDLFEKADFLLKNPDFALKMGEKAREKVLKFFTAGRQAGEVEILYKKIFKK